MSKAYWNGVLSRLPDFCKNMGKTAMMGAMMAEYNTHGHHHCGCCGPSIWGGSPMMGSNYYWNGVASMYGQYGGGYYAQQQNPYLGGSYAMGQSGLINPQTVSARLDSIYGSVGQQATTPTQPTTPTQTGTGQPTPSNTSAPSV